MMRETDRDWSLIGEQEPFYGVLTQDEFLRRNLTPARLDAFWQSGEADVAYIAGVLERVFGPFQSQCALDFGCGVGRLARAMAARATRVVGLDVAESMLNEARLHAPGNVEFVRALPDISFDWINSFIVFQHIPPARGYRLFDELLERLAPGGVVSSHFTLYRDRSFVAPTVGGFEDVAWDGEALRVLSEAPFQAGAIAMYDYDLTRLIASSVRHGIEVFHLEHLNHGGCHGVRFFGRRRA